LVLASAMQLLVLELVRESAKLQSVQELALELAMPQLVPELVQGLVTAHSTFPHNP